MLNVPTGLMYTIAGLNCSYNNIDKSLSEVSLNIS